MVTRDPTGVVHAGHAQETPDLCAGKTSLVSDIPTSIESLNREKSYALPGNLKEKKNNVTKVEN